MDENFELVKKVKEQKLHSWISYVSPTNEDYMIRANYFTCQELGNPRDYNGEPMSPSDPDKVQALEDQAEAERLEAEGSLVVSEEIPESPFDTTESEPDMLGSEND